MMSLRDELELACLIEATARKPGNVHPGARFADLTYMDFVNAAAAAAPQLAQAETRGIGPTILEAVRATRSACDSNVNLGIILLLAPLAAIPRSTRLAEAVEPVLQATTVQDAECVYAAIRLAQPGGLGKAPEQDVSDQPTQTLREVMCLAARRDDIAAELCHGYPRIRHAAQYLAQITTSANSTSTEESSLPWPRWEQDVIRLHLHFLQTGDSLIRRKCGPAMEAECVRQAHSIEVAGGLATMPGRQRLRDFDAWLRADGHRRNPGSSADLVAATLFWAIRDGLWSPPTREDLQRDSASAEQCLHESAA